MPEQRCAGDLDHGAGDGDGFDGEQVGQREMQADAEHQQNDADFGQFRGKALVGDEAGRERADGDAGEQVAHDGGDAQPLGKRAQDEGQRQADDNGGDQWRIVRHRGGWPPCVDAKRMVGLGEGAGRTQPLLSWKQKSRPLRQTARAYGRCFRFSRAKIGRSVLPQSGRDGGSYAAWVILPGNVLRLACTPMAEMNGPEAN